MPNPLPKPSVKPENPNFSSGPTRKHPDYSLYKLKNALLGRSHRSSECKARLKEVIEKHRELLGIPSDYKIAIVPASDTGAVEMAMWSMLGLRGVDIFAWESFGRDWIIDARDQLKFEDLRIFDAPYGQIPDLSQAQADRDLVFTWNGTTSGAAVPNADWIADDRQGLTICDATSAVFAFDMPWEKLDVTTWSWQKLLGGEAAHGMIVLSLRAVERLETYTPPQALPKLFRMTKNGKLNEGLFEGVTINTPSMLAVEDCLLALNWVESIGGVSGMIARSEQSKAHIEAWEAQTDWVEFLTADPALRTRTGICLKICDPWFLGLGADEQVRVHKDIIKSLADEQVAYDCASYRGVDLGFRIWCGGTVETSDVAALLPWMDWAYESAKAAYQQKAA